MGGYDPKLHTASGDYTTEAGVNRGGGTPKGDLGGDRPTGGNTPAGRDAGLHNHGVFLFPSCHLPGGRDAEDAESQEQASANGRGTETDRRKQAG